MPAHRRHHLQPGDRHDLLTVREVGLRMPPSRRKSEMSDLIRGDPGVRVECAGCGDTWLMSASNFGKTTACRSCSQRIRRGNDALERMLREARRKQQR